MRRGGIVGIRRRQADVDGSGPRGIVDQHQALVDAIGWHLNAVGNLRCLPWESPCRSPRDGRRITPPRSMYGRPSSSAASSTCPWRSSWRMRVAQTVCTAVAQQVVAINVNAALGSPGAHLGNARGTAAAQPKVAAHANRADIDHMRQQFKKARRGRVPPPKA